MKTWETYWYQYVKKTQGTLPEKWKVNLLLRMLPKNYEQDIRLRYDHDIKTIHYKTLREQVFHHCMTHSSGHSGMHVGALERPIEDESIDLLKKGVGKGASEGNCNYCLKKWHKARETGQDVCRQLVADRKKGFDITFPKKGIPDPKAKAKPKKGKGKTRGAANTEEDEDRGDDMPDDDESCGMLEEEDDLGAYMLCE